MFFGIMHYLGNTQKYEALNFTQTITAVHGEHYIAATFTSMSLTVMFHSEYQLISIRP